MQKLPSANSPLKFRDFRESKRIWIKLTIAKAPQTIGSGLINGVIFIGLFFCIFSACTPTKNSLYFYNLQKDTTLRNLVSKNYEPAIQKNDLLSIAVASLSPDNAFYNAPQSALGPLAQGTAGTLAGYLVDTNGNIPFVKIGILHVEGMTRKALKDTLEKKLIPYLRDAVVSVGFLNRHVTILGAVNSQVLSMPGDNMTILDALAASGDIGDKGRVDNVLVIREKDDNKEFKRLNLTNNSIFYSPYYYLQPNDIVYVEPVKIKAGNTSQIISYVSTGITLLIFILNQLLR